MSSLKSSSKGAAEDKPRKSQLSCFSAQYELNSAQATYERELVRGTPLINPITREPLIALSPPRGVTPTRQAQLRERLVRGYQALAQAQLTQGVPRVVAFSTRAHELLMKGATLGRHVDERVEESVGDHEPWVLISQSQGQPLSSARRPLKHERAWEMSLAWLWQLIYVMSKAHGRGLIHLNLSPELIEVDEAGVKVLGWELACGDTPTEELVHVLQELTPSPYRAPELGRGELGRGELGALRAADVYALGAISFFLLTGEAPQGDQDQLQAALIERHPLSPPSLIKATLAALHPNPKARPQDAAALATQLFGARAQTFERTLSERDTSELNLEGCARAQLLTQLCFEARLPLSLLPLISAPEEPRYQVLGLKPLSRLSLEGWTPHREVSAELLGEASAWRGLLEREQTLPAGLYRLRWSLEGRVLEWVISLQPFSERLFDLRAPESPEGWSFIPQGLVWLGSERASQGERALHQRELDAFEVKERLVSVADYREFLNSLTPTEAQERAPLSQEAEHGAVTGVSLSDAYAYVAWRRAQGDERLRLLSGDEWEKAIRGESLIERVTPQQALWLADTHVGGGELCVSTQGAQEAIIKGGAWSFGLIASQQLVSSEMKYPGVGFRLARAVGYAPHQM